MEKSYHIKSSRKLYINGKNLYTTRCIAPTKWAFENNSTSEGSSLHLLSTKDYLTTKREENQTV